MTEEVKQPDWRAMEKDYRAGVKSLRTIAGEHSVTEGAIRKRAKRDSWERDLAPKIKAKAEELVRKATVRSAVRSEEAVTEKQEIAINAQVITDRILKHRASISRTSNLLEKSTEELEVVTDGGALFKDLGELMYSPDKNGVDKAYEAFQKVISFPGRIDALKKIAETQKILIALDREAFGMDEGRTAGGPEDFLKRLVGKV